MSLLLFIAFFSQKTYYLLFKGRGSGYVDRNVPFARSCTTIGKTHCGSNYSPPSFRTSHCRFEKFGQRMVVPNTTVFAFQSRIQEIIDVFNQLTKQFLIGEFKESSFPESSTLAAVIVPGIFVLTLGPYIFFLFYYFFYFVFIFYFIFGYSLQVVAVLSDICQSLARIPDLLHKILYIPDLHRH